MTYAAADGGVDSSFMKITTKNVIHQKNILAKKNSQKLRPFFCAINAGQIAMNTHRLAINTNQIDAIV